MQWWWVIGATFIFLFLLPQVAWAQGEQARVGVKTVGNLEIALYAWGPQQVIYPKEDIHHKPREAATHHLDVRVSTISIGGPTYPPSTSRRPLVSLRRAGNFPCR